MVTATENLLGDSKVSQRVRVRAVKPDNLKLIRRTNLLRRRKELTSNCPLLPIHGPQYFTEYAYIHICLYN